MPSSISSFRPPAPKGPWGLIWLLVALGGALCMAGLEMALRSAGHKVSIVDNAALWSYQRREATLGGSEAVALLGSSRSLLDLDLAAFEVLWPEHSFHQLAQQGLHPMAALRDLAGDKRFEGLVIADVTELSFLRKRWEDQEPFVQHFRQQFCVNDRWNRAVQTWLQERLVFLSGNLGLKQVFKILATERRFPRPFYVLTRPDRSRAGDYEGVEDLERIRRERRDAAEEIMAGPFPGPEEWLKQALEVEAWVREIESRGGKVAFVRFPSSGERWDLEEACFPKASYWDRLAQVSGAIMIHFKDDPSLSSFACPDGSHLDFRQAPAFTQALASALERQGFLQSL